MKLNSQEIELIHLTSEGCTIKEVASIMKYTHAGIDMMKHRVFKKTGTKNSAHLISYCYKKRILRARKPKLILHENASTNR